MCKNNQFFLKAFLNPHTRIVIVNNLYLLYYIHAKDSIFILYMFIYYLKTT